MSSINVKIPPVPISKFDLMFGDFNEILEDRGFVICANNFYDNSSDFLRTCVKLDKLLGSWKEQIRLFPEAVGLRQRGVQSIP